ncbi:Putative_phosphoprotein phosphatase [Hexamita inflata]|uniref:Phosphoprotein phosphatase n=1 Tax=Hexamita inflata TaxID=28002 RepID=A0AA86QX38_9EUKA|nr:Putative phosphoprotein phosphatase [Hexamita inflata]
MTASDEKTALFRNMQLTAIPAIDKAVTTLVVCQNEITDISPVKEHKQLTYLDLAQNLISDISILKYLQNVTVLNLRQNKLKDISPLKNLPNVQKLKLGFNQLDNIQVLAFLTKLTYLELDGNAITDCSSLVSLPLTWLDISSNKLTQIQRFSNTLQVLFLQRNKIANIDVLNNLINLVTLNISINEITNIDCLKACTKLQTCWLDRNKIVTCPNLAEILPNVTDLWTKFGNSNQNPFVKAENYPKIVNYIAMVSFDGENNPSFNDQADVTEW